MTLLQWMKNHFQHIVNVLALSAFMIGIPTCIYNIYQTEQVKRNMDVFNASINAHLDSDKAYWTRNRSSFDSTVLKSLDDIQRRLP